MVTGDGWTSQLLTGLAELIDAADVGTWQPSGAYPSDATAIVIRAIPQQPDRLITLAAYPLGADLPGMADHAVGVQVRCRGLPDDPRDVEDLADAVYDLLDSLGRAAVGTVSVVDITRRSYTSLGQDGNRRWETSSNYTVQAMRPTANRID
ncbi:minor capsid protein [Micromonospora sp. HUAS LYJ1]|uniref:minor capsid protein n=1 Tax=Micromonospora sp. HUAS LYJ1 TaxID=3061626 RepID=UPI002672463C|nr:minor capsid protein [Micromonospora sp. HUAS LYJ1]WKU03754.1 minor capsid protein [Micromonospora sp. HUAS LYJ1]